MLMTLFKPVGLTGSICLLTCLSMATAADFDGDLDCDMEDFGLFQCCLSEMGLPYAPGCQFADLDADNDVDQQDFMIFWSCLSAPNVPMPPVCRLGEAGLEVVKTYADAMLAHGRDVYGPQHSGLMLSAMDRMAMQPLTTRPAPPAGIRREDRVGLPWLPLTGANPQLDQNLLRVFYTLSAMTGDSRYSAVADAELEWFFNHTQSPVTGLMPWGEHLSWDVLTDQVIGGMMSNSLTHEFSRPWVLWDRCYALAPQASERFALGLWNHQIFNQQTGAFDRHALYDQHGPSDNMDYCRHAGFYIRTWGHAYKHTGKTVFLTAIETLINRYEAKRHPNTGLIPSCCNHDVGGPQTGLSIDCESVADFLPQSLASKLRALAAFEDSIFLAMPHDLPGQGFAHTLDRATGLPTADGVGTSLWVAGYGSGTTASFAMNCVARYEQTGHAGYRDLIVAAADTYRDSRMDEDVDVWPMTLGHVISLQLAAYKYTHNNLYMNQALNFAEMAMDMYWQDSPLPRAGLKLGHYETISGADTLALALLEVHAVVHNMAIAVPANTIDR